MRKNFNKSFQQSNLRRVKYRGSIIILLTLFCVSYHQSTYAQVKIKGVVKDTETKQAIAYANIGISEEGVGTVSNNKGEFSIEVPQELTNSTLSVSHINYKDIEVKISDLIEVGNDSHNIYLTSSPQLINEVTIIGEKTNIIGYKPTAQSVKGYFQAKGLGGEGGTLINNDSTIQLINFNMNIHEFSFDTLKFRLNFYTEKRNKPKEKINKHDIFFQITKKDTGVFTVPIDESILVKDDFFTTIELIEIKGEYDDSSKLMFSAAPDKKGVTVKRAISMDKWKKIKGYSLNYWLATNNNKGER